MYKKIIMFKKILRFLESVYLIHYYILGQSFKDYFLLVIRMKKPECLDPPICLLFVYSIYVSFHIIRKQSGPRQYSRVPQQSWPCCAAVNIWNDVSQHNPPTALTSHESVHGCDLKDVRYSRSYKWRYCQRLGYFLVRLFLKQWCGKKLSEET